MSAQPNEGTAERAMPAAGGVAAAAPAAPQKPVPVPPPVKPKEVEEELVPKVTRRGLFSAVGLGWLAFTGATAATLIGTVRFLFPNVLFEPPLQFKVGSPSEYGEGQVEEKYKETQWAKMAAQRLTELSASATLPGR